MKFRLLPTVMIAVTLSIVTSKIVYFGFNTNFMLNVFSQESFQRKFGNDVYQYRILSSYLLLELDNVIGKYIPENGAKEPFLVITKGSTVHFYYAFYYLNTFFLVLSSIMLVLLFDLSKIFILNTAEKFMLLFLSLIIINLSQFAICPYDISSYFFQLLILYIFLRYIDQEYFLGLSAITTLIIVSTLNRESSALSVAIILLLAVQKWRFSRKTFLIFAFSSASFIITYMGIRYIITTEHPLKIINPYAGRLLLPENIIGLAFWVLFFLLSLCISNNRKNKWLIVAYHLMCMPYLYTCIKSGALWEIRLYLPMFLGSFFLARLSPESLSSETNSFFVQIIDKGYFKSKRKEKSVT